MYFNDVNFSVFITNRCSNNCYFCNVNKIHQQNVCFDITEICKRIEIIFEIFNNSNKGFQFLINNDPIATNEKVTKAIIENHKKFKKVDISIATAENISYDDIRVYYHINSLEKFSNLRRDKFYSFVITEKNLDSISDEQLKTKNVIFMVDYLSQSELFIKKAIDRLTALNCTFFCNLDCLFENNKSIGLDIFLDSGVIGYFCSAGKYFELGHIDWKTKKIIYNESFSHEKCDFYNKLMELVNLNLCQY